MGILKQFWISDKTASMLLEQAERFGLKESKIANEILYNGLMAMREGEVPDLKTDFPPSMTAVKRNEWGITPDEEKEWQNIIDPYLWKDEAGKKEFNTLGQRAVLDFKTANASILKLQNNALPSQAQVLRLCIEEAKKGELARRYEKLLKSFGVGTT